MDIIQWNCASYFAQFEQLKILIRDSNHPACLCLQETRHKGRALNPPSGYEAIYSASRRTDDHERGVALLVNKRVNFKKLDLLINSNIEAVAARVWLGKYYTICSIYLSPSLRLQETDILNLINQLPAPYLLLGDLNARHPRWGEPISNDKGNIVEKILMEQDIALINDSDKTHYSIQHGTSTLIDLSLCSIDCFPDFLHCVNEDLHCSDHYPIKISTTTSIITGEPSFKFLVKKADWKKFKTLTANYLQPNVESSIDEEVENITSYLLNAAKESIPISSGMKNNKTPIPWWNEECKKVSLEKKRAERALKRNENIPNKIAYRRCVAVCRKTYKEAKTSSWKEYVSTINVNTTLAKVWKRINKIRGKFTPHPPPLLKDPAGNLTDDPLQTSEMFAETFSDVSNEESYSLNFYRRKKLAESHKIEFDQDSTSDLYYNHPFTMQELVNALSLAKESSPGIDQITYGMVQNTDTSFKAHLLSLYNKIFTNRRFPSSWRIAAVIPIPKPNKDHSTPTNFRPISLTSCLCKLMEKMINFRLTWFLEREGCLHKLQSGFRPNRSTTDCLVQMSSDIQEAINRNTHTVVVFFDIMKAYDTAWKHGILSSLYSFGLRGSLPIFIQRFLSERKIKVRIGSVYSQPWTIDEGTPQGSVLSCTLFAVAMNNVIERLSSCQVRTALYVDDLTIYASGSVNTVERQIQSAIKKIEKWCKETGFRVSVEKTTSMHICRARLNGGAWCPKRSPDLRMNGAQIRSTDTHKYLGLVIDCSLRWHKHIDYLRTDCQRRLALLKHISHVDWGADSKTLLRLYIAFIRAKLDYGVESYGSACVSMLRKLDPIQNQALRIATGAYRTSPVASLEVLAGVKPLSLVRSEKLARYVVGVVSNPSNPLHDLFLNICESPINTDENMTKFKQQSIMTRSRIVAEKCGIDPYMIWKEEFSNFPPWKIENIATCPDIIQQAKANIVPNTLKLIYQDHIDKHDNHQLVAYTDGSKSQQGVGYGLTCRHPELPSINESVRLPDDSSIFSAELHAILHAVKISCKPEVNSTTIFTDSKSSIQLISRIFPKNPLASKIQRKIFQIEKKVHLCWVPSHIGIAGNEKADRLANDATTTEVSNNILLTKNEMKSKIKRLGKQTWLQQWRSLPRPNKLREIADDISPLPNSSCSDRRWERCLARLRLGHTRLTHGFLMTNTAQPSCEHCDEDTPYTVKHILVECPRYRPQRLRAFGTMNVNMEGLLKTGDTSFGGSLHKYLNLIKLYHLL